MFLLPKIGHIHMSFENDISYVICKIKKQQWPRERVFNSSAQPVKKINSLFAHQTNDEGNGRTSSRKVLHG